MPPTNDPAGSATILITGLEAFGLDGFEIAAAAAARAALAAQSRTSPDGAEISITFVDDRDIAALNHDWLGRAGPTDVLSFGLGEGPLVADIYVSVDTARRNAGRYGVEAHEELLRLVVHGVLHAAGYDHPEDETRSASEMFLLQEGVVDLLLGGLPET